jgi:hypothetical protein
VGSGAGCSIRPRDLEIEGPRACLDGLLGIIVFIASMSPVVAIGDDLLRYQALPDLDRLPRSIVAHDPDRQPGLGVEVIEDRLPEALEVLGLDRTPQSASLYRQEPMSRVLGIFRQLQGLHERCLAAVVPADDEIHAPEGVRDQLADTAVSRNMYASDHAGSCGTIPSPLAVEECRGAVPPSYARSNSAAPPWPPPTHIVTTP